MVSGGHAVTRKSVPDCLSLVSNKLSILAMLQKQPRKVKEFKSIEFLEGTPASKKSIAERGVQI